MVAVKITTQFVEQRISKVRKKYMRDIDTLSKKMVDDGQRVMQVMVPRDTGALENAVVGWIEGESPNITLHFEVTDRNDTEERPVSEYARYMNDGWTSRNGAVHRPYKLGKNSRAKKTEAGRRKVGMNFTRRAYRYISDTYRKEFMDLVKKSGMKARWSTRS